MPAIGFCRDCGSRIELDATSADASQRGVRLYGASPCAKCLSVFEKTSRAFKQFERNDPAWMATLREMIPGAMS